MAVITLSGLTGGGARALGPIVAQMTGADYVDRLILASVAREVGATVEALHQREERPPTRGERFSRVLQRILARSAVTGAGGDPYFGPGIPTFLTEEYEDATQPTITRGHELEDEKYFEAITNVIRDLAAQGNVVIVGRGANVILRDVSSVLRVGVVARLEDRIRVLMAREQLDDEQARSTIEARDQARALHFSQAFGLEVPDSPELYHLVINTSDVDLDYAAELVIAANNALQNGSLLPKVGATA